MKYLRYILVLFSTFPILFGVVMNMYYWRMRNAHDPSIPDSVMNHDTSSFYYHATGWLMGLCFFSILPGIGLLLFLRYKEPGDKLNRGIYVAYLLSVILFIIIFIAPTKALAYYFD